MGDKYFEKGYQGPWKGIDTSMPENMIDPASTFSAQNWIMRSGELRTRPRRSVFLPGLPDGSQVLGHTSFTDSNNVQHTVVASTSGLWQLNSQWQRNIGKVWNNVGYYNQNNVPNSPAPVQFQVFVNSLFFVNGSSNLWYWNGITPNSLSGVPALQSYAVINQQYGLTAGAYFIGELDSYLVLLNTIEQIQTTPGVSPKVNTNFQQRIRWSASGLPNAWDPTVNTGAGFNDELDVPDTINGFLTIGMTGFVFRVNGITEMTTISGGVLPFDFNHLWASERGIGNVYPWSICNYGPVGIFIANDDVYELSLGGFQKIGGLSRNAIFADLSNAISSPIASIFPSFGPSYPYLTYMLSIQLAGNVTKNWMYFVEDNCWMPWTVSNGYPTGRIKMVPTI